MCQQVLSHIELNTAVVDVGTHCPAIVDHVHTGHSHGRSGTDDGGDAALKQQGAGHDLGLVDRKPGIGIQDFCARLAGMVPVRRLRYAREWTILPRVEEILRRQILNGRTT